MLESLSTHIKEDASLTQESFDHLLSCLGPDRESAANAYVRQWRALVIYFAVRGAKAPDLLADETFDRVARRLSEGQTILTENPANYFYGVARNVWRESRVRAETMVPFSDEASPVLNVSRTPLELMLQSLEAGALEKRLASLDRSLAQLSVEDRDLIIRYYHGGGGGRIRGREALASRLGVSGDSLRHRVARLRTKLARALTDGMRSRPPSR